MTGINNALLYLLCILIMLSSTGADVVAALSNPESVHVNARQFTIERSDEKVIEKVHFDDEPVEFSNLSVKQVRVELNQKFSAKELAQTGGGKEEDWIESLEFTIKNKSDKRITYLQISFEFIFYQDRGLNDHRVFGVDPRASGDAATYAEPFALEGGDRFLFKLSDQDLKKIKEHLSRNRILLRGVSEKDAPTYYRLQLADINRLKIRITTIGYEDGMQWQLGKYSSPEKLRRSDEKVIERRIESDYPYEIGEFRVKGIKIESAEPYRWYAVSGLRHKFSARAIAEIAGGQVEEWLEDFNLTFRNKSDKRVTYVILYLGFPDTEVNGPLMIYYINLGNPPEATKNGLKLVEPLSLESGESVVIKLSVQQLKEIKDFLALRKFQLAHLNKVTINVVRIDYADGIMWSVGSFYRPNDKMPTGYERIQQ